MIKKETGRKISAAAAAVFCFILLSVFLCLVARAESEDNVPRATFTNAEPTTPDLYVSKTVEDADSRYPSDPDTEFSFILKLDGELAKKLEYEVYGEDGQKVIKTENGVEVPYKTDSNGGFTLKAGQRAKFTYVGEGVSYEITETDLPDGYTQISPAGTAAGTVEEDGAFVSFTNRYMPVRITVTPTEDEDEEEEETTFTVSKSISWPSGYEYDTETEFTFTLTIDGSLFTGENYSITDTSTGESTGSGTTDSNGQFTLKAGQTAKFTVPLDADYKITEETSDGWTAYGGSTQKGATAYPCTETFFTNIQASFAVQKTTDSGTDESFTFYLYDSEGKGWADQSYYLYGSDGARADDTVYQTDSAGKFTLKAGQTAMFIGIAEGTEYSVMEEKAEGWTQTLPLSEQGYTDKTVLASVEILPFVNEKEETPEGSLTVTKKVSTADQSQVDTTTEFPFILYVDDAPVASAVYSITTGNSVKTYKTDDEGRFTIHANQSAVFQSLETDKTYKVEEDLETLDDKRYSIAEEERVQEATMEDTLSFTFTNIYTPYGNLTLTKADKETNDKLKGAVYGIYTDEECTDKAAELTTGEDGTATSEDLLAGTYYVKEITAPTQYSLSDTVYTVEVVAGETVTIHDEDSEYVLDTPLKGSITLTKYGSDGETPLEGVTFELTDEDGNVVSSTTGSDGVASFKDLDAGSYEIAETKTVSGYTLLKETIKVTLPLEVTKAQADEDETIYTEQAVYDEENEVYLFYDVSYTVTDNAVFTMPTAGNEGFPIGIGLIGLSFVTGGVLFARRKKKKQK